MDKGQFETLSEFFKALAHPLRVQIVCGLMQKHECNVNTMVEKLGVPQPTVSQHLNILKHCGIIEGFRKGNQICYKVVNKQVEDILKSIIGDL
jgi:ArsR family transcriptional regulator